MTQLTIAMAADPKDPTKGAPASPPAPAASGSGGSPGSGAPDRALAAVRLPQAWVHDGKERALVPSRPMIARDLDRAAKGQLVYVGRDGEVKDPARVRNRQVAWYLAFGGIMAVGVTLAATSLPLMIPFYAALCGRLVGQVRAVKRVNQASAALSNGDTAAGRALAEPVSRAWWAPGRVRIARRAPGRVRRRARRPRRSGPGAAAPGPRQAVAPPGPVPVLLLHRDQPPDRARPHQGGPRPARQPRRHPVRRGPAVLALDRRDAPRRRRGQARHR